MKALVQSGEILGEVEKAIGSLEQRVRRKDFSSGWSAVFHPLFCWMWKPLSSDKDGKQKWPQPPGLYWRPGWLICREERETVLLWKATLITLFFRRSGYKQKKS